MVAGRIRVGTSSWADPGFIAEWYPPGLPARERLGFYAQHFDVVEVNTTFYGLPDRNAVARWAQSTPDDFTFDIKLHRLLSRHTAQLESLPPDLRDQAQTDQRGRVRLTDELERAMAERLLAELEPLREAGKLGVFLLQLTPAFAPGRNRLDELDGLVAALAPHCIAVELRNRGWVAGERAAETFAQLSERGLAFVCVDSPGAARADGARDEPGRGGAARADAGAGAESPTVMPPVDAVTCDQLSYLRAHGRNREGYLHGRTVAERFGWRYSDEELEEIVGRVRGLAALTTDVRTMFNNNRGADAPHAAQRFKELIGQ